MLLAVLGGSAAVVVLSVRWLGREHASAPEPVEVVIPPVDPRSLLAEPLPTSFPARSAAAGGATSEAAEDDLAGPTKDGSPLDPRRASERELYEELLRQERARPGSLAAQARSILDGEDPAPRKVALLRALRAIGSPETFDCLEHAARSLEDVSGPHGGSVPGFALRVLAQEAGRDERAEQVLARLSFADPLPSRDLRRRAAAHLAAHCRDVAALRTWLWREQDELLIRDVVLALRSRPETPGVQAILDDHPQPAVVESDASPIE